MMLLLEKVYAMHLMKHSSYLVILDLKQWMLIIISVMHVMVKVMIMYVPVVI